MHDMEAANARHVAKMCANPDYAYEVGYNAGHDRKRLDTTWVDMNCAPATRDQVRYNYRSGYEAGIARAPLVVPARARTYSYVERCTFSSDCGEGRTCRQNQCMGHGYAGDACWFSSDCLSGSCDARVCR